jgi:DHA2 family multidrug resistance protein
VARNTPLRAAALSTLPPENRPNGAGLFNLARNIGSGVGIFVVNALITRNTQVNRADIAQHVTAINRAFENPATVISGISPTAAGRAALEAVVVQHAQTIAYVDDKLLLVATLAAIPMLSLFKGCTSARAGGAVVTE